MATRTLSVAVEMVAAEHGVWCDRCLLSSATCITLAIRVGGGPLKLGTGARCDEHGWLP